MTALARKLERRGVAGRPDEPELRDVLSADEAAAFLGVGRNLVYDYANRGQIPHRRLGRRMLFSRAALMRWLEACKSSPTGKG